MAVGAEGNAVLSQVGPSTDSGNGGNGKSHPYTLEELVQCPPELLLEALGTKLTRKMHEYLTRIHETSGFSTGTMKGLARQCYDIIGRIDAAQCPLEHILADIKAFIKSYEEEIEKIKKS